MRTIMCIEKSKASTRRNDIIVITSKTKLFNQDCKRQRGENIVTLQLIKCRVVQIKLFKTILLILWFCKVEMSDKQMTVLSKDAKL